MLVYVAPRDPSRSITPEGVEKFYRDVLELSGKHAPHSRRSTFSTVCREAGKDGDRGRLDFCTAMKAKHRLGVGQGRRCVS